MPTAIDRNGFEADVDGGEMRTGRDTCVALGRGREVPAKPGRVLTTAPQEHQRSNSPLINHLN